MAKKIGYPLWMAPYMVHQKMFCYKTSVLSYPHTLMLYTIIHVFFLRDTQLQMKQDAFVNSYSNPCNEDQSTMQDFCINKFISDRMNCSLPWTNQSGKFIERNYLNSFIFHSPSSSYVLILSRSYSRGKRYTCL